MRKPPRRNKQIMLPTEHQTQCAIVKWFRAQYPRYSPCLIANPNGGVLCDLDTAEKRKQRMAYLYAEGFKNGVSDLLLALPRKNKAGLWLELKREGGSYADLTDDQIAHLKLMREVGYDAQWAAGFDQAVQIISDYMAIIK